MTSSERCATNGTAKPTTSTSSPVLSRAATTCVKSRSCSATRPASPPVEARYRQARETQTRATDRADHSHTAVAAEAEHNREALLAAWNAQRG